MPKDNPKISIIMPSFNQGAYLEEAIRSVLDQDYPNKELIVVDGGSKDNSVDILKRYGPRLAYWVSEPDRGQSHALNKALPKATGEIIGWLNSDDYYLPGAFRRVIGTFHRHPDAVLVHGNRILIDRKSHVSGWTALPAFDPATTGYSICSETVFWRRAAADSLSFNESLHFAMDLDFFGRLYHLGRFVKLTDYLGAFRCYAENKSSTLLDVCAVEGEAQWKHIFPRNPDGYRTILPPKKWPTLLMFLRHPLIIALPYLYRRFGLGLRGEEEKN